MIRMKESSIDSQIEQLFNHYVQKCNDAPEDVRQMILDKIINHSSNKYGALQSFEDGIKNLFNQRYPSFRVKF